MARQSYITDIILFHCPPELWFHLWELCFLQLDNDGPQLHGLYSFAVITDEEEMLLAANSEEEKYKWMEVRFQLADVRQWKVVLCFVVVGFCFFGVCAVDNGYVFARIKDSLPLKKRKSNFMSIERRFSESLVHITAFSLLSLTRRRS